MAYICLGMVPASFVIRQGYRIGVLERGAKMPDQAAIVLQYAYLEHADPKRDRLHQE